jgi:hypothetical protein
MGIIKRVPGSFNDPADYLIDDNKTLHHAMKMVNQSTALVDGDGEIPGVIRKRISAYFPVVKR